MPTTLPTIPDAPTEDAVLAAYATFGGDPADFDGYEGCGFESTVLDVMAAMRDADMFAPYSASFSFDWTPDEGTSGGQMFLLAPYADSGTLNLSSTWIDLKHLTDDRAAKGGDGIYGIACSLHAIAATTIVRAQQWLNAA